MARRSRPDRAGVQGQLQKSQETKDAESPLRLLLRPGQLEPELEPLELVLGCELGFELFERAVVLVAFAAKEVVLLEHCGWASAGWRVRR